MGGMLQQQRGQWQNEGFQQDETGLEDVPHLEVDMTYSELLALSTPPLPNLPRATPPPQVLRAMHAGSLQQSQCEALQARIAQLAAAATRWPGGSPGAARPEATARPPPGFEQPRPAAPTPPASTRFSPPGTRLGRVAGSAAEGPAAGAQRPLPNAEAIAARLKVIDAARAPPADPDGEARPGAPQAGTGREARHRANLGDVNFSDMAPREPPTTRLVRLLPGTPLAAQPQPQPRPRAASEELDPPPPPPTEGPSEDNAPPPPPPLAPPPAAPPTAPPGHGYSASAPLALRSSAAGAPPETPREDPWDAWGRPAELPAHPIDLPHFFELRDNFLYCLLCNQWADQGHMGSKKHLKRTEHAEWYLSEKQQPDGSDGALRAITAEAAASSAARPQQPAAPAAAPARPAGGSADAAEPEAADGQRRCSYCHKLVGDYRPPATGKWKKVSYCEECWDWWYTSGHGGGGSGSKTKQKEPPSQLALLDHPADAGAPPPSHSLPERGSDAKPGGTQRWLDMDEIEV
ncbi:unnamed protein product [Prorocentrum cordatum]|uniref:Uncharacterized protein n=1 Tax=Prorocentrum cordatum TaxID=2364126 RepID=A0ABN9VLX7_9DINO|nr:unnamed protein product [Polarella glacialis]